MSYVLDQTSLYILLLQNKNIYKTSFCITALSFLDGGSTKTFFPFFRISGPTGAGNLDASIQGESLGRQDHSNDTSNMGIGLAVR